MARSRRAKAAARAAKRVPIVGAAVIAAPILGAASDAGLSLSNIGNMQTWKTFLQQLQIRFTHPERLAETYTPIAAYLVARRFAGRHISRILGRFGLRF